MQRAAAVGTMEMKGRSLLRPPFGHTPPGAPACARLIRCCHKAVAAKSPLGIAVLTVRVRRPLVVRVLGDPVVQLARGAAGVRMDHCI